MSILSRGVVVILVALGACASSCTLALSYPASVVEADAHLCHDGVDNDFDDRVDCEDDDCRPYCGEGTRALCRNGVDDDHSGAADCADPSCRGLCAEESRAACTDGIDQDGDALVDLADPSCWPAATTTTTRCVVQAGVSWTATLDPANDAWSASSGGPTYVADPAGRYSTPVLAIPPGPAPGELARLTNATLVTGAIEGLTASASIYLPGIDVEILVQLVSPTSPPPGAPSEITVAVGGGGIEAWTVVDGAPYAGFRPETHPAGWYDVMLTMQPDALHVVLTDASGTATTLDVPHPSSLSSQAALQFAVSHTTGTHGGLLGAASIQRGTVYPCGMDVVVPPIDANASAAAKHLLSVASDGAHALCVLAVVGNDVTSFRSDDGGRTFGPSSLLPLFISGGSQNPCATIAWDAERGMFAGVAWSFNGTTVGFAGAVTSADCRTWAVDESPDLATDLHMCRDYSIVRGRDGTTAHELWATGVSATGDLLLARLWSPVPFGTGEVLTDDPTISVADSAALVSSVGHESVHAYTADLLVSTGLGGSMHTFVVDRDLLLARDWLVEGPSHTEGSCDATSLSTPSLYFDGPSRGGVAHSCGHGGFFEGGPTVVRTFEIAFPSTMH